MTGKTVTIEEYREVAPKGGLVRKPISRHAAPARLEWAEMARCQPPSAATPGLRPSQEGSGATPTLPRTLDPSLWTSDQA